MDLFALRVLLPIIRRCSEIILVVLVLSFTHIGICDSQSFGYTYLTSDDETGPVYEWIEISDTGTTSVIDWPKLSGDISEETIPVGFPFCYGGD